MKYMYVYTDRSIKDMKQANFIIIKEANPNDST